jgi:hypothetical protein
VNGHAALSYQLQPDFVPLIPKMILGWPDNIHLTLPPKHVTKVSLALQRRDLAIIVTGPNDRDDKVLPITTHTLAWGDEIEMVGFGHSTDEPEEDSEKRIGKNWISNVSDGFFEARGYAEAEDEQPNSHHSSLGEGDSGSPLIRLGEIYGIATSGGVDSHLPATIQQLSRYVRLDTPIAQAFLKTYRRKN